jgi:hypothetical protein
LPPLGVVSGSYTFKVNFAVSLTTVTDLNAWMSGIRTHFAQTAGCPEDQVLILEARTNEAIRIEGSTAAGTQVTVQVLDGQAAASSYSAMISEANSANSIAGQPLYTSAPVLERCADGSFQSSCHSGSGDSSNSSGFFDKSSNVALVIGVPIAATFAIAGTVAFCKWRGRRNPKPQKFLPDAPLTSIAVSSTPEAPVSAKGDLQDVEISKNSR